jgi:endonuclease YncB( thermonuclease family)
MISGPARAVDGDTLEVAGQRVRLEGIDAPEYGQSCSRTWIGTWACGKEAQRTLARMLAGQTVSCENKGSDKYGRMLGVCRVAGEDVNAAMVRRGLAWAFVKYSNSYVKLEAEAKAAGVGIWQGFAEPAWVYRNKRWATAEEAAPDGCAIKGNVTEKGQIYHMPWSPWYAKVRIDKGRGERWFCSEADAIAAGWRPVVVN